MKTKLLLLFCLVLSFGLTACGVLRTNEGIPRKLVIRKDGIPLYSSVQLNQVSKTGHQWQVFFMYEDNNNYYKIAGSSNEEKEFYFVKKEDVFEWNSYFCLDFKNSPQESNRERIKIYKTLAGLKAQNEADVNMIEKQTHSTTFYPNNCQPVLQKVENENQIYYIASLYDNIDEKGNYVFLGNYDFGYGRYSSQAHRYYRYISKVDLQNQVLKVLEASVKAEPNLKPDALDDVFKRIGTLIGGDIVKGVKDLEKVIQGKDIPTEPANQGVLEKTHRRGQDIPQLDNKLIALHRTMVEHLNDLSNWNSYGYSFIPTEWMEDN